MPRFLVTSDSHFTPFSFEELIKPLEYKQEQHNAAQDAYDALSMGTSALADYISDNPDDSKAKAMYTNYTNKLNSLQENLWNNGVTAQTRRDLSIAREGFSRDIQRLSKAVERRQNSSKEYWDYAHKNKDAIMGIDPGTYGLNYYLDDDNFGSEWFSYNGSQFMSEVGADAKARASELRRNIGNRREVPGYITRVETQGFTNDEVDAAIEAVRNGSYVNLGEGAVKILADTFADHLNSTGAIKGQNISDEQYNRFFGYGRTGLAQGILGVSPKDFNDDEYDYQQKLRLAKATKGVDDTNQLPSYNLDSTPEMLESSMYRPFAKFSKRQNKKFDGIGGITIKMPDGTSRVARDAWEATDAIYETEGRRKGREIFGVDVTLPAHNLLGTTDSKQVIYMTDTVRGNRVKMITGGLSAKRISELGLDAMASRLGIEKPDNFIGIYSKGHVLEEEATRQYNWYRLLHQSELEQKQNLNPGIDFSKYAITPEEQRRLTKGKAKDLGITPSMSSDEIRSIINTSSLKAEYTPSVLVGAEQGSDFLREDFGRTIETSFMNIAASEGINDKGKLSKGSNYTIKVLGNGLTSESGEIMRSLADVFGTDKNGNPIMSNLNTVELNPFDIADDPKNPTFRFTSKHKQGLKFRANVRLLGDKVEGLLKNNSVYNGRGFDEGRTPNGVFSISDAVAYMMMPLTDPGKVMQMDNLSAMNWYKNTCAYLGIPDDDELDAKEFVKDGDLGAALYGSIVRYLNDWIAPIQQDINDRHMTHAGLTKSN